MKRNIQMKSPEDTVWNLETLTHFFSSSVVGVRFKVAILLGFPRRRTYLQPSLWRCIDSYLSVDLTYVFDVHFMIDYHTHGFQTYISVKMRRIVTAPYHHENDDNSDNVISLKSCARLHQYANIFLIPKQFSAVTQVHDNEPYSVLLTNLVSSLASRLSTENVTCAIRSKHVRF